MKRIINVPKRGIGATTIAKVQDYADENGMSFYAALRQAEEISTLSKATATKIRPFVTFYSDAAQQAALYQCGTTHG